MHTTKFLCQNLCGNALTKISHPLFSLERIRNGVFIVQEKYFDSWNKANIYYLQGEKQDLLVDTGVGIHCLPSFLKWCGFEPFIGSRQKPLSVVLTHTHFDHSGGLYQFGCLPNTTLFVHENEVDVLHNGDQIKMASWITREEVTPKPSQFWNSRNYRVESVTGVTSLRDKDVIDLGDSSFQVLHTPGHTGGSISLLEKNAGILITGDTLYQTDEELIDWYPPNSSVRDLKKSVEMIHGLAERHVVDLALPGHNIILRTRDSILDACLRHMQMATRGRQAKKMMSRARTLLILSTNQLLPLPTGLRSYLKQ